MNDQLTGRQQQVLGFIQSHHREHGVAPSLREIQAHFGLASPFGIKRHVDALIGKGVLRRLEGKARGLLPPTPPVPAGIPLYGTIPAGLPTAQEQEPEAFVPLDPATLGVHAASPPFSPPGVPFSHFPAPGTVLEFVSPLLPY